MDVLSKHESVVFHATLGHFSSPSSLWSLLSSFDPSLVLPTRKIYSDFWETTNILSRTQNIIPATLGEVIPWEHPRCLATGWLSIRKGWSVIEIHCLPAWTVLAQTRLYLKFKRRPLSRTWVAKGVQFWNALWFLSHSPRVACISRDNNARAITSFFQTQCDFFVVAFSHFLQSLNM